MWFIGFVEALLFIEGRHYTELHCFSGRQNLEAIHHRGTEGTEFYIVNCAAGAANNTKVFLCVLCASVVNNF